jgi:thiamine-monophosphate kinase
LSKHKPGLLEPKSGLAVTVSDLGEHALLARLLARLPRPSVQVLVGPGDDAAVLAPVRNERLVVATDAVVEGVHFSRAFFAPADIGHKALAVNLSDLAAMAATPQWALLSLVLPGDWLVADVEGLVDGLTVLAVRHGVSVVGGNITRTAGPLVVDVTVGGSVPSRKWLTRSGAVAGDEIWVSGTLGGAAAGLEMLSELGFLGPRSPIADPCLAKQRTPEPRVRLGVAMGRGRAARAAMDLSDGLADAVRQVAAASGCGARLEAAALPIEPGARAWWEARGVDPIAAAIGGGEDYELLFAVPRKGGGRLRNVRRHVADPVLTRIGVLTKDTSVLVERDGREELLPEGFEHFANR